MKTTGVLRMCGSCLTSGYFTPDGSRYSYVTIPEALAASYSSVISQLRATNPNIKILVYKNLIFANKWGSGIQPHPIGLDYYWVQQNHPEWFLHDTNGNLVQSYGWPNNYLLDPANSAMQAEWVKQVLASCAKYGFDGVHMDDANDSQSMGPHLRNPATGAWTSLQKYPWNTSTNPRSLVGWNDAMNAELGALGPQLGTARKLSFPNLAVAQPWTTLGQTIYKTWVAHVSGSFKEYYQKNNHGAGGLTSGSGWLAHQWQLDYCEQNGKILLANFTATKDDLKAQRYVRGSFLLGWRGGKSATLFVPFDAATGHLFAAVDPYDSTWTADLGTPSGDKTTVAPGVYRRNFSGGYVIVNTNTVASSGVPAQDAIIHTGI